jgi:alpha-galactosidase
MSTAITTYTTGDRPTMRYVSGTTVYEEALEHGRWIGLYWSASGQVQRENTVATLPGLDALKYPLHSFELQIDGQTLHNRWAWVDGYERPGPRAGTVEAVAELRHTLRPVTVRVVTRLDGTAIIMRYLEVTNTGDAPAALAAVAPWSGVLWSTPAHPIGGNPRLTTNPSAVGAPFRVGSFGGEAWGEEGDFRWQDVQATLRLERATLGRGYAAPYFIAENRITGQRGFLALGWSGNYAAEFGVREETHLVCRLTPLAPASLRVIAPGETVTTPAVHLGLLHGTLDVAVAAWHAHLRDGVLPPTPPDKAMFTVAGRVVEEPDAWIHREMDIAAEMGVEAFMVDAGWYGDTFGAWPELRGDWTPGSWLPGGIDGLRDYCHGKGLLFGLWHEAEAIAPKSRLAAEHPDWVLSTDDGRPCGATLNLAHPDAARFVEETVVHLIRDYRLDFYKLDYNEMVREGGQTVREGYAESEFWRHAEVIAQAYARARAACPGVVLENCAGGGGRLDIGLMSHFHYGCESDWSVHPIAIRALNALTLFLPPEALAYYHNHINWGLTQAHLTADLDTHLRVALFARPIFVGFGAQNADRETEFFQRTRRVIGLHKGFCRPVLANHPVVYHHTPDIGITRPVPWCVLEYGARDRARGYAGVFKLAHDAEGYLFRPRGIDRGAAYAVTLDNTGETLRLSGADLIRGIPIDLDAALTSELVLYERL